MPSDNFNRADGDVGSNYSICIGGNLPDILSNQVVSHSSQQDIAFWNADSAPADQYSEVKVASIGQLGPAVRCSSGHAYILFGNSITGAAQATLYRVNSSISFTSLGSYTMPTAGQIWRLEIHGTSLQPYIDGVADGSPATDSTYSSGQYGFFVGTGALDDWNAGGFDVPIAIPAGSLDFTGRALSFTPILPVTNFQVKFQHA